MRIYKYCPNHGKPPGNIIGDWRYRVTETISEENERVTKVYYPFCKCELEYKRPYNERESANGYIYVNTPDGYMAEHRYVWEKAHGKLEKGMVVHHINGIRSDNRLENLIALNRGRHNSNIPQPFSVTCPHCSQEFQIIKQKEKEAIILERDG